MNIVAISNLRPQDTFIFRRIHERWPFQRVIQPDWDAAGGGSSRWNKLAKSPIATIRGRLHRSYENWRGRRYDRLLANLLYGLPSAPSFDAPREAIGVSEINSEATARLIAECNPDVIITSACPLLKPRIFGAARLATLNIHWGIAPQYRGDNTLFWPLYFGDSANIGVTIHQIDEGIDTGPILAQAFPALDPNDTEATIVAKCATIGASLLEELLVEMARAQTVKGRIAKEKGRLWRRRDRTLRHDAIYWLLRKTGRRKPPLTTNRRLLHGRSATTEEAAQATALFNTPHANTPLLDANK